MSAIPPLMYPDGKEDAMNIDTLLLLVSFLCFLGDAFVAAARVKLFSLGVAAFVLTLLV